MARPNLNLGIPEIAATIDLQHARERNAWRKNRLQVIRLAARGEHSAAQIAELCGISRGRLFEWIKTVRNHGLEALMKREKPGPKPGRCRGLEPAAEAEFRAKLAAGEFVTVAQAQRWLKEAHGIERPYHKVWRWLKKAGGVRGSGRGRFTPKKTPRPKRSSKGSWRKSLRRLTLPREAGSSSG